MGSRKNEHSSKKIRSKKDVNRIITPTGFVFQMRSHQLPER